MVPSGSTDSISPTCSEPQTIRSPGAGDPWSPGIARPLRSAHSQSAPTDWNPSPSSPSGMPAWAAHQEAKSAHQGPTTAPWTALRYSVIRGDSLEPGGISAWPTWVRAAATAPSAAGLPGIDAELAEAAWFSSCEKLAEEVGEEAEVVEGVE